MASGDACVVRAYLRVAGACEHSCGSLNRTLMSLTNLEQRLEVHAAVD